MARSLDVWPVAKTRKRCGRPGREEGGGGVSGRP